MNDEDKRKLDIVKDFDSEELYMVLDWYQNGMFYDRNGQPYTREYILNRIRKLGMFGKGFHA